MSKGVFIALKNKMNKRGIVLFFAKVLSLVILMGIIAIPVYAGDPNVEGIDKLTTVVDWIAAWAGRIGLVVAFFGALQTVLGFMNDDADSKVRGLKTLAAGFMVWGISESTNLFFD